MINSKFREPFSGFSHMIGAIISLLGLCFLLFVQLYTNNYNLYTLISTVIFGISLILLYTASSVYHLTIAKESIINILRKIDHAMIFVLIAGTYTPICLVLLETPIKYYMLSSIWGIAIIGILFKVYWIDCPSWLSSAIYIVMGWMAIFILNPLSKVVSSNGLLILVLGGVLYTIGGVIYCLERKGKHRTFGAHEIFHIFVLLGSITHYYFIYRYVFNL
ncbi:hemolysin III family protein [Clostridium sp. UBA1056]|uniref:PAQR family membrane homeostasis protein TrhA n=1 Tax=unclassified Clostridium TaxID=2614128 RepID=UPI003216EE9D